MAVAAINEDNKSILLPTYIKVPNFKKTNLIFIKEEDIRKSIPIQYIFLNDAIVVSKEHVSYTSSIL